MKKRQHAPTLPLRRRRLDLRCSTCRSSLSAADLDDFGLRTPEPGESSADYCDAELLDPLELRHLGCMERESDTVYE
jgi:hypothetical protein